MTGAILIGFMASSHINAVSASFYQVGVQVLAVAIVAIYAWIITTILLKILDSFGILRVSAEVQEAGLDDAMYGEHAYNLWNMDRKLPE